MKPHAVYRLLDHSGDVIYVGCSQHLKKRLREHRRKTWGDEIAAFTVEEIASRSAALEHERMTIAALQPKHNVAHTSRWVPGGWETRLASRAARHARDQRCQDVSCAPCYRLNLLTAPRRMSHAP